MEDAYHGTFASPAPGQKRHADDDLENEQRLSKRFNLLNLEHDGKLYIPINDAVSRHPEKSNGTDSMHLDDTKDKVYIYNLDDEISDAESEDRLVFLPDIEKRLTKIPESVLIGQSHPATMKAMVVYNVPESLSIPQEQDGVRKAIIETRARAREKQAQAVNSTISQGNVAPKSQLTFKSDAQGPEMAEINPLGVQDEDAMEIG